MTLNFVNKCLQRISRIHYMDGVRNKDLWDRTRQVQTEIYKHSEDMMVMSQPHREKAAQVVTNNPQGKRNSRRPKTPGDVTSMNISRKQDQAGNSRRGLGRTGSVGENLWMTYLLG